MDRANMICNTRIRYGPRECNNNMLWATRIRYAIHEYICLLACLLGPTTYCESLTVNHFQLLFVHFTSFINLIRTPKLKTWTLPWTHEQSTSSVVATRTESTHGLTCTCSVARAIEVTTWQSVNVNLKGTPRHEPFHEPMNSQPPHGDNKGRVQWHSQDTEVAWDCMLPKAAHRGA